VPEGDTIHGAASRLRASLVGHRLTAVELPRVSGPTPAVGVAVTRIEARGKHLLIWLSDGHVIHSHLRMTGVWRIYRHGEKRRHSPAGVRIRLRTTEVDEAPRRALVTSAADLLAGNVGRIRTTVPSAPPGSLWVYDRTGRPCRRCGTPIESAMLGNPARRAYWCPACQSAGHQ